MKTYPERRCNHGEPITLQETFGVLTTSVGTDMCLVRIEVDRGNYRLMLSYLIYLYL